MEEQVPLDLIRRLAELGKKAGLSCEDMIFLLRSGVTVEKLLELIDTGLMEQIRMQAKHRLI